MILTGNKRAKLLNAQNRYDDAVRREICQCLNPLYLHCCFWLCFYYYSVTLEKVSGISPKLVLIKKKSSPIHFTFLISIAVIFSTFLCFSVTTKVKQRPLRRSPRKAQEKKFKEQKVRKPENILKPNRQIKSLKLKFLNENFSCSKIAVVLLFTS